MDWLILSLPLGYGPVDSESTYTYGLVDSESTYTYGLVDSESTNTYWIVDSESTYTYGIVDSESTYRHGVPWDISSHGTCPMGHGYMGCMDRYYVRFLFKRNIGSCL